MSINLARKLGICCYVILACTGLFSFITKEDWMRSEAKAKAEMNSTAKDSVHISPQRKSTNEGAKRQAPPAKPAKPTRPNRVPLGGIFLNYTVVVFIIQFGINLLENHERIKVNTGVDNTLLQAVFLTFILQPLFADKYILLANKTSIYFAHVIISSICILIAEMRFVLVRKTISKKRLADAAVSRDDFVIGMAIFAATMPTLYLFW